jgi:hypothetical protein
MPDRPKKAVDLANTVANNASRRAWTRLELPSHQGSLQQAKMDNDGRIWTNLILLRIRRLGVRVPPSAPAQRPPDALPGCSAAELCLSIATCHPLSAVRLSAALPNWTVLRSSAAPGGAAGPASAPGSASEGPPGARRAAVAGHIDQPQLIRHPAQSCALPSSSLPVVQLASTASMRFAACLSGRPAPGSKPGHCPRFRALHGNAEGSLGPEPGVTRVCLSTTTRGRVRGPGAPHRPGRHGRTPDPRCLSAGPRTPPPCARRRTGRG